MKNGLICENGELIYYKNDKPHHAGVIQVEGDIYYIGRHGKAVKGYHVVHGEMAHGLLKHGTYKFGEDYKLVKDFYVAPKRIAQSKKKSKKKFKKVKPVYITLSIVVLLVVALLLQTGHPWESTKPKQNSTEKAVVLPTFEEAVLLCSPEAKQFYDGKMDADTACKSGNPYRPFAFKYGIHGKDGRLLLSEHADLSKAKEYVLDSKENVLYIHHLKTNTTYYYRAFVDNRSYDGYFQTAASTRFLSIPGLCNVRDIGGVTTMDGKTIKQGQIIRGTEMDGLVEPSYFLQTADIPAVQQEFGFVYDFDLRANTFTIETPSRLGAEVKHTYFAAPAYGAIFTDIYQPSLKNMFATLADPANYPMYMHCTYGADRTGTLVFLLQGVLGVSEEQMRREFHTTGFALNGYDTSNKLDIITAGLESFPGDTLQEKIVSFLTSTIGVTQAEIDSIRSILLEE